MGAEIHQIIQIFGLFWSQLKARKYYARSWNKALLNLVLQETCECILYFYGEIWGIPENVPIFLKNAFHIPEERHLEFASLEVFEI